MKRGNKGQLELSMNAPIGWILTAILVLIFTYLLIVIFLQRAVL